jgi:hypothetical protein
VERRAKAARPVFRYATLLDTDMGLNNESDSSPFLV